MILKRNGHFQIPVVISIFFFCAKHPNLGSLQRKHRSPVLLIEVLHRALQAKPSLKPFDFVKITVLLNIRRANVSIFVMSALAF